MYIRYMEVCNLASHTTAGVYFKKLSPSILHTLISIFIFVISLMSSNDCEQQQQSLFEIIAFDQTAF